MKNTPEFEKKIVLEGFSHAVAKLKHPIVFTNGCFDIIHRGHVTYLAQARSLGASLIVGINSDTSVRLLNKGAGRPINALEDRMAVLAALESVSIIIPFEENTPLNLILAIRPDILVKGGDWPVDQIVGANEVQGWGGLVYSIPFIHEKSTTALIKRLRS